MNHLQCCWICINISQLLQLKNLKIRSLIYLNSSLWVFFPQQMFEILYLDILLETKLSYSYKFLPLSSMYHTQRYVYKNHLYIYVHMCVLYGEG